MCVCVCVSVFKSIIKQSIRELEVNKMKIYESEQAKTDRYLIDEKNID